MTPSSFSWFSTAKPRLRVRASPARKSSTERAELGVGTASGSNRRAASSSDSVDNSTYLPIAVFCARNRMPGRDIISMPAAAARLGEVEDIRVDQNAEMGRIVCTRGNLIERKLNLAGDIDARLSLAAELKQLDSQAIPVFDVNGEKAGVDERCQHAVGRGAGRFLPPARCRQAA